jgi:hypothetical protein
LGLDGHGCAIIDAKLSNQFIGGRVDDVKQFHTNPMWCGVFI